MDLLSPMERLVDLNVIERKAAFLKDHSCLVSVHLRLSESGVKTPTHLSGSVFITELVKVLMCVQDTKQHKKIVCTMISNSE